MSEQDLQTKIEQRMQAAEQRRLNSNGNIPAEQAPAPAPVEQAPAPAPAPVEQAPAERRVDVTEQQQPVDNALSQNPLIKPDTSVVVPAPQPPEENAASDEDFVSDTFAAMESPSVGTHTDPSPWEGIDLSSVTIDDTNLSDIELMNNRDVVLESKRAGYNVTVLQSGYSASMNSLKLEDKSRISSSQENPADYYKRLYLTTFNRLDFKDKKPSFENWLKMTGYVDVDTLLFGLYAQTYPGKSTFDIECPKCKTALKPEFLPENLISTPDNSVFERVDAINTHSGTISDIQHISLVNTVTRKLLPESGIIFDIRTPSLRHHLNLLEGFSKQLRGDLSEAFVALMFTKQLLIPNMVKYRRDGVMTYIAVTNPETIVTYLADLSLTDSAQLEKSIDNVSTKYNIDYRLPKFDCAQCNHAFDEIPLRMEQLLSLKVRGQM